VGGASCCEEEGPAGACVRKVAFFFSGLGCIAGVSRKEAAGHGQTSETMKRAWCAQPGFSCWRTALFLAAKDGFLLKVLAGRLD